MQLRFACNMLPRLAIILHYAASFSYQVANIANILIYANICNPLFHLFYFTVIFRDSPSVFLM